MLRLHLFAFLAISCGQSLAAEYQWSVEVAGVVSEETGKAPRAFLWLPVKTERVKGLVYAPQNMLEQPILESAAFRAAMTRLDFGLLWITPSPGGATTFGRAEQAALEGTIQALAVESGYESLIAAPLVPMGHSAAAEMPYLMAARMPHRVLAGISLKGAWPEKQPWVKAFGESGVPLLWVSGEYEWADERAGKAQAFRQKYPKAPLSMLVDAGGGHFDHHPALTQFLADYIAKAAQHDKRPVDATKTGMSIPRWKQPQKGSFWCFDDEHQKATEALQNAFLGRKPFLLGYTQNGSVVDQVNGTHQQVTLKWSAPDDELAFSLHGAFLDSVPPGRPERWTGLKAGSPITHPDSKERIIITPITGPVQQLAPDRFALRLDRADLDNPKRAASMWFQAEHPGDATYQRAVQQAMLPFPFRNTTGKAQRITFEPIADQLIGQNKSLTLHATSDAGLKVRFFVREGPAEIVGDELRFTAIAKKARLPMRVTVVAWQWGQEGSVQTAEPVTRTFSLTKPGFIASDVVKVEARIDSTKPGLRIPSDFAGLSREWRRFPAPSMERLDTLHPVYAQLLRNLRGIGIRIGGASADGMKAPPDVERLKQLAQAYDAVRSPMVLTINLAHNDFDLCQSWIARVREHLPAAAIRGFELGNEPDGWFGRHKPKDYQWDTYFDEFAAMRAKLVPAVIPSVIGPSWAHGLPPDIAAIMVKKNPGTISMLTGHAYAFAPSVGREVFRLLRNDPIQQTLDFLKPGIDAAKQAGLPFRLDEAGSAWGGGASGFSDSFASALWMLDLNFTLAQAGLAGINYHGGGRGHYSAIQDDTDDKKPVPTFIRAMPTYYALLVFQEMIANEAQLLPVTADASSNVKLWAVRDASDHVRVLVINKAMSPADVTLHVSKSGDATLKRLEAPAIAVSEGLRWAGQTFDDTKDGKPMGELKIESSAIRDGRLAFRVAGTSAVVIKTH